MRAIKCAVGLVACVAASEMQHVNPQAIQDPQLRELYLHRLEVLRHHKSPAVDAAQGKLRGTITEASMHMNDAAAIKRNIAQKQALLRNQKHKQNVFQSNLDYIEKTHDKLVQELHQTIDPKINRAQAHLKKKQAGLQNEQDATKYWADQTQTVHSEERQAIEDRDASQKKLAELQGQLAWRTEQQKIAAKKAEYDKQMADDEVGGLTYAKTQYEKEATKLQAAKEVVVKVEQSVGADESLRAMEQVEDSHRAVRAEEDEMENWKDNVEHMDAQASEMVKQSKASQDNLVEMQSQVAWTQQQQVLEEKQYKLKTAMAAQEMKTLNYVETKAKAEASKLKVAELAARDADHSVQKLDGIRIIEEEKVKQHLALGKNKFQNKFNKMAATRTQTASEIASLEKQYAGWSMDQQQESQQIAKDHYASELASQAYGERQAEAFARAQAQVYQYGTGSAWDNQWAAEGY